MKRNSHAGYGLLMLFGALIWGLAFAFQSIGMESTGPFTFTGTRFFLAAAVVFIFSIITDSRKRKTVSGSGEGADPDAGSAESPLGYSWKSPLLWKAGIITGILLTIATNLQQIGIIYTDSVGKAGFITALYIVIVPVLGIFLKKKINSLVWLGVILSLAGLYFLTMNGRLTFSYGDILMLSCAFVFALQIMTIDKFSKKVDNIKFACIEFLTVSVISLVIMFIFEKPNIAALMDALIPILYTGVLSGGVAYTLQIVCQSRLDPGVASILMSCEALFSVLGGFVILGQKLTVREMIGSLLMFIAILIVQLVPQEDSAKDMQENLSRP